MHMIFPTKKAGAGNDGPAGQRANASPAAELLSSVGIQCIQCTQPGERRIWPRSWTSSASTVSSSCIATHARGGASTAVYEVPAHSVHDSVLRPPPRSTAPPHRRSTVTSHLDNRGYAGGGPPAASCIANDSCPFPSRRFPRFPPCVSLARAPHQWRMSTAPYIGRGSAR